LLFKEQIRELIKFFSKLINNAQKVEVKGFLTIIQNPNISEKVKLEAIRNLGGGGFLAFRCNRTKGIKNVAGNETLFKVPFENCDENSKDGVFTAEQSGLYSVEWRIVLEGITNQTKAVIQIESTNKTFNIPTNNLTSLRNDDGTVTLEGKQLVEFGCIDRASIAVKVGTTKNSKTVHLAARGEAEFYGFFLSRF